ncbi:MAG TPA: hypothetical protein ENJ20_05510 [Bacteroidetes bacterium]|nr:hypothetical protein [Bacteroidota bacterium]
MAIVTLTTDFGLEGYYPGVLKGVILNENPDVQLVDITHGIKPYDIVQAAFVLNNTCHTFPPGTVHLVSVDNRPAPLSLMAFEQDGHFFIGPDNGLFSLMFGELPHPVYRVPLPKGDPFPFSRGSAGAIAHITAGKPLVELGLPVAEPLRRIALQPVTSPSQIRGSVIYTDHYGNVIVNIRQELFEKVRNKRRFRLFFKRHDPIVQLSRNYHDVPVGETLCLFNDAGFLTIAINMGRAAGLLGLKPDDMVQIDFEG